jgi:hypothetical protein
VWFAVFVLNGMAANPCSGQNHRNKALQKIHSSDRFQVLSEMQSRKKETFFHKQNRHQPFRAGGG